MDHELIFYWIGIVSSGFFILIGMSVFAAYVMNLVWRKFKDGKELVKITSAYRQQQKREET